MVVLEHFEQTFLCIDVNFARRESFVRFELHLFDLFNFKRKHVWNFQLIAHLEMIAVQVAIVIQFSNVIFGGVKSFGDEFE